MRIPRIAAVLLVFLLLLAGCGSPNASPDSKPVSSSGAKNPQQQAAQQPPPPQTEEKTPGNLKVHFLDVGQADSILIQFPNGQSMLVDSGNNADGPTVVSYLNKQGLKKIDYLVATHPHEDHISGMDDVIRSFEIGQIFMPRATTTTKTFEDVLLDCRG